MITRSAQDFNGFLCLSEAKGMIINMKNYIKFGGMIATSTVIMFILMYLNTYSFDHVFFSETRLYMALLMGAAMAIIMLVFMLHMLNNRRLNIGIVAVSLVVFGLSLFLVRSQITVDDTSYMKAMIPHHFQADVYL